MKSRLFYWLVLLLAIGCKQQPQAPQPAGTPAALQDRSSSIEIKRYSGSGYGNLVDEIYQEMAEADTALRAADKKINKALAACKDTLAVYELYQEKTMQWLAAARTKVQTMNDSLMRKQWYEQLAAFEQAQTQRVAALQQQVDVARRLQRQLEDQYSAVKLKVSKRAIAQYQQNALPPVAGVQAVQQQLQQAIDAAQKLPTSQ